MHDRVWFATGSIVTHEDSWYHVDGELVYEKFTITRLEEYDENDPHNNVWVKDESGHTRYFDETQLELVG